MRKGSTLQPHEIRVIKIGKSAIFDLLYDNLGRNCYERFQLPGSTNSKRDSCLDFYFDEDRYEIVLYEHRAMDIIDKQLLNSHIKDLAIEATDSLYMFNGDDIVQFFCQGAIILPEQPDEAGAKVSSKQDCWHKNPHPTPTEHIRLLEKNEVRIIRLSKQAIHELFWEYFMEFGNEAMDISEEIADDFPAIFRMYIDGKLDSLTVYVMNLNDASESVFETVDAYCRRNIHYTTTGMISNPANGTHFVSVPLSNIC